LSTHYDSDIRALLFDLGNVLVEIDFSRVLSVWASYAGITAEELVPRFSLQDKDHERFERGEITSAHFFNSVRETLRIDITNAQFLEGWNSVFVGEITGIDDVVKRASLRYPLYVFSNTTLPHHVVWQNLCPELLTKLKDRSPSSNFTFSSRSFALAGNRLLLICQYGLVLYEHCNLVSPA
jgi:putative hydrolase of the HAD superfamily